MPPSPCRVSRSALQAHPEGAAFARAMLATVQLVRTFALTSRTSPFCGDQRSLLAGNVDHWESELRRYESRLYRPEIDRIPSPPGSPGRHDPKRNDDNAR